VKFLATSAFALAAALTAPAAHSATLIQISSATLDLSEMLHANAAGTGSLLTLKSAPGNFLVDASITSGSIAVGNGNGVAEINGPSGPQSGYANLTLDPQLPLLGFSAVHFKIDGLSVGQGKTKSDANNFDLRVYYTSGLFDDFLNIALNTSNKYLLTAEDDEIMSSLVFSDMRAANGSATLFRALKQFSFNGVQAPPPPPPPPAVPEPATWGMMIGGLALVGVAMRRKKVAVQFA
jgi:hypothetical protein